MFDSTCCCSLLWRKRTSNSSSNKANKVRTRGRHGSQNNLTRHCPRPCALVHSPVLPSPSLTLPSLSLAPLSWLLRRRPYPSRHCPKQPLPSSSAVPPIDPHNFVSLDSSRFEHYSLYRPDHPSSRYVLTVLDRRIDPPPPILCAFFLVLPGRESFNITQNLRL